jgi:glycosyltransferase involved in cell wall biosynthesis
VQDPQSQVKSIWIVKHYGSTPEFPGGSRQYNLARSLAKRGYRVTYFLSRFHYLLHRDIGPDIEVPAANESCEHLHLVWIPSMPYIRNDWRRTANMIDFACRFCAYAVGRTRSGGDFAAPDLLVANNVPLFAPLAAQQIAKRFGARFVLEIGDLWPQTLFDMGELKEASMIAAVLRWIEMYLYRHSDRIITPLPFINHYFSERGIKLEATYIGSGENIADFKPDDARKPEEREQFTLMYIGAHGPANNLHLAIEAMAYLDAAGKGQIGLVLVGEGVEKANLRRSARRKGLGNVTFVDAVPKSRVPEVLSQADAFLLPLKPLPLFKYGVNSNKLVDYLCAGKPVIFAGALNSEIVEHIGCGLSVASDDPVALAEAIAQLAAMDVNAIEKMGQAGRRYAERWLDAESVVDNFLKAVGYN